jgi:GxxExxY protein
MVIHYRGTEVTEGDCYGLSHVIIGAAIEVHRHLGPGLLESVYEVALGRELSLRGLSFKRQVALPLEYKGSWLGTGVRLDLVVERQVIVEVKSVDTFKAIHTAQVLTYLRLTELRLGLLINFNVEVLRSGVRRVING